jgi:regulatory protein YycH of two-component signal transduction system YycFG
MTIDEYLAKQEPERKALLTSIHRIILKTNKKVSAEVAPMMGSDMIQYKVDNYFQYALASQKNHMTLHVLPMYGHKPIHEKYSKLLKKAKFQKGCINFKNADEIPLDITEQLFTDCAKIDWVAIMEKYKKKR